MKLPMNYKSLYSYLLSDDGGERDKCYWIKRKLNFVRPPVNSPEWLRYRTYLENEIKNLYKMKEEEIIRNIKEIFDFDLPKVLVIIPIQKYGSPAIMGKGIYYMKETDACIIGFMFESGLEIKNMLSIILHELLHILILKYDIIPKHNFDNNFEDALLDYFVPRGILSGRLGLIEQDTVEGYYNSNSMQRNYAISESRKLLPYIKEYYKSHGEDVWKFLSKKGFKEVEVK